MTSLLRHRLGTAPGGWCTSRLRRLGALRCAHGLGIGTDLRRRLGPGVLAAGCVGAVAGSAVVRAGSRSRAARRPGAHRTGLGPTGSVTAPMTGLAGPGPGRVTVHPGPALLAGIADGAGLAAHRCHYGAAAAARRWPRSPPRSSRSRLRGRGGAAFPFATKLDGGRAAGRVRWSWSTSARASRPAPRTRALALTRPHLVLDGAVATARALRRPRGAPRAARATGPPSAAPSERRSPSATTDSGALARRRRAVRRRAGPGGRRADVRAAEPAGHLVAARGRVRSPRPPDAALQRRDLGPASGSLVLRGAAAYAAIGTPDEPGPTLLTLASRRADPVVVEAAYGAPAARPPARRTAPADRPCVGGFHGSWATLGDARQRDRVGGRAARLGTPLGRRRRAQRPGGECPSS